MAAHQTPRDALAATAALRADRASLPQWRVARRARPIPPYFPPVLLLPPTHLSCTMLLSHIDAAPIEPDRCSSNDRSVNKNGIPHPRLMPSRERESAFPSRPCSLLGRGRRIRLCLRGASCLRRLRLRLWHGRLQLWRCRLGHGLARNVTEETGEDHAGAAPCKGRSKSETGASARGCARARHSAVYACQGGSGAGKLSGHWAALPRGRGAHIAWR